MLAAAPDQPDLAPDEVGKRHAAAQFVEKAGRKGHALRPLSRIAAERRAEAISLARGEPHPHEHCSALRGPQ